MAADAAIGRGDGTAGIVHVLHVDDTVGVLILDLPSAYTKGIEGIAENQRLLLAGLLVIIGDLRLVLHDALVLVGIDTIDGPPYDLVFQIDIAGCLL